MKCFFSPACYCPSHLPAPAQASLSLTFLVFTSRDTAATPGQNTTWKINKSWICRKWERSFSPPPLILDPPLRVDDPSSAIYDLVSAFHPRKRSHRRASTRWAAPLSEGIRSRAGMLEIAGLGCLGCRVSALILGSAHRNGIVCSCSWLASRSSIRLGFIHFTTNGGQVSPILRTTPFEKPEIWYNTCGQHGSHWRPTKPDKIVCVQQNQFFGSLLCRHNLGIRQAQDQ